LRFPLPILAFSIVGLMSVNVSAKTVMPTPTKTKAIDQKKKTASAKPQPDIEVAKPVAVQTKPALLTEQTDALLPQANDEHPPKHKPNSAQLLVLQVQGILPESTPEEFAKFEPYVFTPADPNNLDMLWPVETRSISSAWGPRVRTSVTVVKTPNGKRRIRKPYTSVHRGIDLTAPRGHGIFAAMDGTVSAVGSNSKLGKFVKIDHGNGVETVYGHNSTNLVKIGDTVRRGQIIAKVGSTGHSTGPHVHFEVLIDKLQVNPAPLLNGTEEISAEMMAFNENFQSSSSGRL